MKHIDLPDKYRVLSDVAKNNKASFKILYEHYHKRIYSLAYHITHSHILAEEVTQEIFIKIWDYRSKLTEIKEFDAWLKVIIRNLCYTYLARLSKERIIIDEFSKSKDLLSLSAEEEIIYNEFNTVFLKTLDTLSEQQKKVFLLSRNENSKYEDISKHLNISINTVKSHMKVALKKMRLALGENLFFL